MRILVSLAVLSARLAAQQSGVAGIVVDQTNGKPLERVHVTLMTGKPESSSQIYGALSDPAGHFSIAGMNPGVYRILAERSGYVQVPAAAKPDVAPSISLKAGEPVADLKVEMAHSAMIAGHVTDRNGDPLAHIGVRLEPLRQPRSLSMTLFSASNGQTDERGEFRLLAAPGKYYLQAVRYGPPIHGPPEVRGDGSSEPVYAPTYYPSALTKDRATLLEIEAGQEIAGMDIRLAPAAVQQLLTVSGAVTGLPAGNPGSVMAMRVDRNGVFTPVNGEVDNDGKFSLSGLQPGGYELIVQAPFSKTRLEGRKRIMLDSDMGNVEIAMGQPGELTGTVVLIGLPAAKRTVTLEPSREAFSFSNNAAASADLEQDGSFHLRNVAPGKFALVVDPLPDTAYLKTVELDGAVISDGTLELTGGGRTPHVKVTVAADGGVVTGRALDSNGELVAQDWMTVLLLTEPKRTAETIQTSMQDGKFTLKGIPPGKYRLVFLNPERAYGDDDAAQEALAKLFAAAEEIEIHPGDRITKNLKIDAKQE